MNKESPQIVSQNNSFLIVNKPSGWITNEAKTTGDTPVLQTWIKENMNFEISKNEILRSGVVHRLDKETSGIILVAKTEETFRYLQKQFKERKVQKTYLTLLHGRLEPEEGSVNAPTGRLPWNRERFGVFPGGKNALTNFKVTKYYKKENDEYSLVEAYPKTGRTHQIRIHMKYLDHPVVSDEFYAGRKTARNDRKWCPRLFLHAYKISFIEPLNNKRVEYKADLPTDLKNAINELQKLI